MQASVSEGEPEREETQETNAKVDKNKRRQPGPISRSIDRLFATVLFVGALFYHAPWKVTLVTALFFADVSGLIPDSRAKRRWTARCLMACLVLFYIWLVLPDNSGAYEPFTFADDVARIEHERAVPDEENARFVYERLLNGPNPKDRRLPAWMDETLRKHLLRSTWVDDEYPEVAQWLTEREAVLRELETLVNYGQCRWPRPVTMNDPGSFDKRGQAVRAWGQMLVLAANRDAGEENVQKAIKRYQVALRMADHHVQQNIMFDYLVGLATDGIVFDAVSAIVVNGSPTSGQLTVMHQMLAESGHNHPDTWPKIMEFECLCFKNTFCRVLYEISPNGKIRFSRSSYVDFKKIEFPLGRRFYGKMMASGMWVVLPRSPWEFVRCVDERFEGYTRIARPGIDPNLVWKEGHTPFRANHEYALDRFMNILESGIHRVWDIRLRHASHRQACKVILMLRRHKELTGQWPANLTDVAEGTSQNIWTDPLIGEAFRYEREGSTFRLYSKGANGIDEKGIDNDATGADDFLFWPIAERSAPREGTETGNEAPDGKSD